MSYFSGAPKIMAIVALLAGASASLAQGASPALLRAAIPKANPRDWIVPDDMPKEIVGQRVHITVSFDLTVGPDGTVSRCDADPSSGAAVVDQTTCLLLMKRARFVPARDEQGVSAYGVFRSYVIWDASNQNWRQPIQTDVVLALNKFPPKLHPPIIISPTIMVDATGHVTRCEPGDSEAAKALGAIACRQVTAEWSAPVAKGVDGKLVASIQNVTVGFYPQDHPPSAN